ncbi:MAG TPA: 50S ribosomal protein L29 [Patescibacteria group bacterium]
MKKTDKMSYRQKTVSELNTMVSDLHNKLVETRSKLHTGNLKDTASINKIKYEIAFISTLIQEKQHE